MLGWELDGGWEQVAWSLLFLIIMAGRAAAIISCEALALLAIRPTKMGNVCNA